MSITLSDPVLEKNMVHADVTVKDSEGKESSFTFRNKYEQMLTPNDLPSASRVLYATAQLRIVRQEIRPSISGVSF
jgi:hypothetical protein